MEENCLILRNCNKRKERLGRKEKGKKKEKRKKTGIVLLTFTLS